MNVTPQQEDSGVKLRERFNEIAKSYYGYVSGNNPSFDKSMWQAMLNQFLKEVNRHTAIAEKRAAINELQGLNQSHVGENTLRYVQDRIAALTAELDKLEGTSHE